MVRVQDFALQKLRTFFRTDERSNIRPLSRCNETVNIRSFERTKQLLSPPP